MKIQLLSYSGNSDKFIGLKDECVSRIHVQESRLSEPNSLDEFTLNIIDLTDEEFWKNRSSSCAQVNSSEDTYNINEMIEMSSQTKILLLCPSNIRFRYNYYSGKYNKTIELKSMINYLESIINSTVICGFNSLKYEKTKTQIGNDFIEADFYFSIFDKEKITKVSYKSKKPTAIISLDGRKHATFLKINTKKELIEFLIEVNLLKEKEESEPEWMGGIDVFDDKEQTEAIEISLEKIKEQQKLIDKSNEILEQNKRYKSILYTQGDELVEVIFDMIEEMLEINLSEFVDERKEDIGFKIGDEYFIGEIKGIADNVKAGRLSQLDNHLYHFMEKNENIPEENIRRLLIVNHQRKRPLNDRDPIDINQINLAINKYGSLIIETSELLKLFEKFRNKEISKNEVIKLFQQTGKLTIE